MFELVEDLGNGVQVKFSKEHNLVALYFAEDTVCLSVFDPDSPDRMFRGYLHASTELASASGTVLGDGYLHMGGAGLTVPRALGHLGARSQTVVDIDRFTMDALLRLYPMKDPLEIIEGDARDHAHLVRTHPTVLVDVSMGPMTRDTVELYEDILERVVAARDDRLSVICNVHVRSGPFGESAAKRVADCLAEVGSVFRWDTDGLNAGTGAGGNIMLATTTNDTVARLWELRGASWGGWSRRDDYPSSCAVS